MYDSGNKIIVKLSSNLTVLNYFKMKDPVQDLSYFNDHLYITVDEDDDSSDEDEDEQMAVMKVFNCSNDELKEVGTLDLDTLSDIRAYEIHKNMMCLLHTRRNTFL